MKRQLTARGDANADEQAALATAGLVGVGLGGGGAGNSIKGQFTLLPTSISSSQIKWESINLISTARASKLINASDAKVLLRGQYLIHQGDASPAYIKSPLGYYFPPADKTIVIDSIEGIFFTFYYTHMGVVSSVIDMKNRRVYSGDFLPAQYKNGRLILVSNIAGNKQYDSRSVNLFPYPEFMILDFKSQISTIIVFQLRPPIPKIPKECFHRLSNSNGLIPYEFNNSYGRILSS